VSSPDFQPLDFQPLDPKVRIVWIAGQAGPVALAGVVGAIALTITDLAALGIAILVGCSVVAISMALLAGARYRYWRWAADASSLELRHGVVLRTASSVPFARIQQIDITQGPVEQWLGLATLAIRTAAATSDATIPGIPLASAESVRASLLRRAGRDDAV
jgi:membrane protein YdbS with pleckstrin-like domain